MPMVSPTSSIPMLSLRVVLVSTVFLSAGMMLKFSAPALTEFAVYEVPSIYNGVVSWLRPPYLYLVINCIIISIVASSKLQSRNDADEYRSPPSQPLDGEVEVPTPPQPVADEYQYDDVVSKDSGSYDEKLEKGKEFESYGNLEAEAPLLVIDASKFDSGVAFDDDDSTSNKENEAVIAKYTQNQESYSKDPTGYSTENVKPPVSARLGHRKSLKSSPEGGKAVLGVSKPRRQDTLESTWKTITEGRSMPLTRHLKKNDTWEKTNPPKVTMTKTETFNDRTSSRSPLLSPSPGSGKLKKEPSLSQDELNRRVEAFIKKFNEDMRLQRQESLDQYAQMVKHVSR